MLAHNEILGFSEDDVKCLVLVTILMCAFNVFHIKLLIDVDASKGRCRKCVETTNAEYYPGKIDGWRQGFGGQIIMINRWVL
jgi:hypothetical protein